VKRRTRKVKLNSKNFKVNKGTVVYIAKQTGLKSAPRKEVVEAIRDIWNSQPAKLLKHIKKLSIVVTSQTGSICAGYFDSSKDQIKFYDAGFAKVWQYQTTAVHELAHAKFWILYQYHREELKKFCDIVNKLDPLNKYQARNEAKWRKQVSNQKILDNKDNTWCNAYPNEIHSFIAEFLYRRDLVEGEPFHCPFSYRKRELEVAINAFNELHQTLG